MRHSRAVLCAAALLTSSCGYIGGGPVVPLANVPMAVTNLVALQRGSRLHVNFTVPQRTTENNLITKPLSLDLRVGTGAEPFNAEDWAGRAHRFDQVHVADGIASCDVPAGEWTGKEAIVGVRAVGANGKASAWSNWVIVPVVAPPSVPSNLKVENVPAGLRVSWSAAAKRFRILRRTGTEDAYTVTATVDQPEWTDAGIEYGKPYSYQVQTLAEVGPGKIAESDLSPPSEAVVPKDTFPPAVPTGLRGLAAPASVELNWERNTEPDFARYVVYRAIGDAAFEKLAETAVPSYSDSAVEHGKSYRYAITAVDLSGNPSARSEPVTVNLQ